MEKNHLEFLQHLKDSEKAVWFIAHWLWKKGHNVQINKTTYANTHQEWEKHADTGDLYIKGFGRIEVKQVGICFSNAGNWKFGDKFIVCQKHSWDRSDPKPYAYIILSKCNDYVAIVKGSTSDSWYVEKRQDNRYENHIREYYLCPLSLIHFQSTSIANIV